MNNFINRLKKLDISHENDINELITWIKRQNEFHISKNLDLANDLEVLKYIRKIDHKLAMDELIDRLFHYTNITDEEFENFLKNPTGNHEAIKKILGNKEFAKLRTDIIKKKSEAEIYFGNYRHDFIDQVMKEQNKTREDAEKIVDENYKEMIINSFTYSFAKNAIFESFLESHENTNRWNGYSGDNDFKKLYNDIAGIGIFNRSDKTYDSLKFWGKEGFYILGTQVIAIGAGAVTMGLGYAAVNAAVWGTRGIRGLKYAHGIGQAANNGSRLSKVGRFGAMSVVEGTSFYAGYGAVQSIAEGENMYSLEGLGHSIAFAGAFRALRSIPGLQINPNLPLASQKLKITSALAVDTAAISALSAGIDGILFEPGEWTAEQFMQAFVMAIAFRGMAHAGDKLNLKFRKKGDRVEVSKNNGVDFIVDSKGVARSIKGSTTSNRNTGNNNPQLSNISNIPKNIMDKINQNLSKFNLSPTHKETIKTLLKTGAFWGFLGTAGHGGLKTYSGEYDDKSILEISGDLANMFITYGTIMAGATGGIMLVNSAKQAFNLSSGKSGIISSIPHKKAALGTVVIGGIIYAIYNS